MNIFVPGGEEDVPSDHSNSFVKEKTRLDFFVVRGFQCPGLGTFLDIFALRDMATRFFSSAFFQKWSSLKPLPIRGVFVAVYSVDSML
jgi:hypothetical protein